MKRFYKDAGILPQQGGYAVQLDGRSIMTPDRHELILSSQPLAEAIAQEWQAQSDTVQTSTMPLTQWATALIDRVAPQRDALIAEMESYLDTDLVCYHAEGDDPTGAEQVRVWAPALNWFHRHFHAQLQTTTGLEPLQQCTAAHQGIHDFLIDLTDAEITVAYVITRGSGSVVLALAYLAGGMDTDSVYAACFVEEMVKARIYHEDFYGAAPDQERRRNQLRHDLETGKTFLALVRQ